VSAAPASNRPDLYIAGIPSSVWSVAWTDISQGVANYRLWMFLAWQDIRTRYRRSLLGPFWLTLSTAIMVTMMSILYGRLFKLPLDVYAPYLASSTIIWSLMSSLMNEGCNAFMDADSLIKQVRMPLTLHVCRTVWRNFIVFAHNFVILVPVWLIFGTHLHLVGILAALAALLVIAANGLWIGLLLGALCARYRDIALIVTNLVQVVFFVTPVMWLPSVLEGKGIAQWLVVANPFYHFLEVVRAPLLGQPLPATSWAVVAAITALGLLLAGLMLGKFKGRIAYWL
jgi:ABC-type polysaccharide/polyol phosphate export permease